MKTKWLFLVALALIFSACEKDAEFRGGPPDHAGKSRPVSFVDLCDITETKETPLIAGQKYEVGTVKVEYVDDHIIVTYETEPGWLITETHLHISATDPLEWDWHKNGEPVNRGGNPMVGNFTYGNDSEYKDVEDHIYRIPWNGGCYYIAAHAVVNGMSVLSEASGTAQIVVSQPVANADSYFPNISVSDNLINGNFKGWCLEADKEIDGEEYTFEIFSSYGDLPDGYDQEFLNRVNWILNQRFQDMDDYTHGDVQMAIWVLKVGATNLADAIVEEPRLDCSSEPMAYLCGKIEFHKVSIDDIVSQAILKGSNFMPGCGGVFAIILINPDQQDLIIEYPVRCGEETAWGQGCPFTGGNWAMYFRVCL